MLVPNLFYLKSLEIKIRIARRAIRQIMVTQPRRRQYQHGISTRAYSWASVSLQYTKYKNSIQWGSHQHQVTKTYSTGGGLHGDNDTSSSKTRNVRNVTAVLSTFIITFYQKTINQSAQIPQSCVIFIHKDIRTHTKDTLSHR